MSNKELGAVRYRKIVEIETGRVKGWLAHRLNFTDNTFEVGYSLVADGDVYNRELGKQLAVARLNDDGRNVKFSSETLAIETISILDSVLHVTGLHEDRARELIVDLLATNSIRDFNALTFDACLQSVAYDITRSNKYRI